EDNRKRNFVELNPVPVGLPVDPEVLRKAAVGALRTCEIDQGAQRGSELARSGQSDHAVDHVAGPHQMVTAKVLIALGLAPGDAERSDECAGIGFVFMGEKQLAAAAIEGAAVAGEFIERKEMARRAMPLFE